MYSVDWAGTSIAAKARVGKARMVEAAALDGLDAGGGAVVVVVCVIVRDRACARVRVVAVGVV